VVTRPYTQLLGSASGVANQSVGLFTAQPGYVTIIRDILYACGSPAPTFLVLNRTTGTGTRTLIRCFVSDGDLFHLELRQVIPVGSTLTVIGLHQSWDISVTGYVLLDDT